MQIGSIRLANNILFAPLAGISNLPLRLLAKEAGCGLVYTEMVSANGLVYGSSKTAQLMQTVPEEHPLAVQLFGADPAITAEAACQAVAAGAAIIDINFGCSVKKIVKTGSGVALMRVPDRAEALLKAVREAIGVPLTIKIRSGWDASGKQALEIARVAEACGVDALAIHPRSASQGFRGQSDWSLIATLKRALKIPVIGNGDIVTAEDALRMLSQTGCDGVMIGRAAIGNPFIFTSVRARLAGKNPVAPTLKQHFAVMKRYLRDSVTYLGEQRACLMMRSRLGWFVKGLYNSGQFRKAITRISTLQEAMAAIERYESMLAERPERHEAFGPAGISGVDEKPKW
ncbi:MAG: tRNA dihydrouridine synthase DusB [Desulfobacterales bacterium]|jgi:nifR3 family TIM-barrel protein